jgi:hypothetical protein
LAGQTYELALPNLEQWTSMATEVGNAVTRFDRRPMWNVLCHLGGGVTVTTVHGMTTDHGTGDGPGAMRALAS